MVMTLFNHIGLNCVDPVKIEEYYSKYFDFKRSRVFQEGSENPIVMIKSGDIYLELFKVDKGTNTSIISGSGPETSGWRHICFSVDNLDEKLKELGEDANITAGPLRLDDFVPGMRVCWIADPEGNIIELSQGYADE